MFHHSQKRLAHHHHHVLFINRNYTRKANSKDVACEKRKKILLLGITDSVLANAQQQLARPDLEVFLGKSVEDVRSRLSRTPIDHVFIGGRLAEETHLEIAWEVIQASETTTVHLQDRSGPEGFLPFVQAVLRGLVPDKE
jgi:hypothetical protein